MGTAGKLTRRIGIAALAAGATLAFAGTATAGTAIYTSTDVPKTLPSDSNGISTLTVPSGRPAVQSVDVVGVRLEWAGEGTDWRSSLRSPAGTEIQLYNDACDDMPANSNFTLTDNSTILASDGPPFCTTQLVGGSGRPNVPLSTFAGTTASGQWSMPIRENGVVPGGSKTLHGWGLRIVHAPLVATGSGKKQKLRSRLTIQARCDTDCDVATGGNARPSSTPLTPNTDTLLKVTLKKKARKRLAKGGAKAQIKLTFTNVLGDVVEKAFKVRIAR